MFFLPGFFRNSPGKPGIVGEFHPVEACSFRVSRQIGAQSYRSKNDVAWRSGSLYSESLSPASTINKTCKILPPVPAVLRLNFHTECFLKA